MDTSELRGLYNSFIALGEAGGFGPPPAGEWRAEIVLAHIARNDERLLEVTEQVLAGGDGLTYDNNGLWENDSEILEAYVKEHPDLVGRVRSCSDALMAAVERLDEATGAIPVHTTITHAGHVVLDAPVPWGQVVAGAQLRHIGMHIEQLQDLLPA